MVNHPGLVRVSRRGFIKTTAFAGMAAFDKNSLFEK